MDHDERLFKPGVGRKRLNKSMRPFELTPREFLEVRELIKILQALRKRRRRRQKLGLSFPGFSAVEKELLELLKQKMTYSRSDLPQRQSLDPLCNTISSAFEHCGWDISRFQHCFAFKPNELSRIVKIIYPQEQYTIPHKGRCSREELLLLVLFRLRLTVTSLTNTGLIFGREEEFVRIFTNLGFDLFYKRFYRLLDISNVKKIFQSNCFEIWKKSNIKKYRELSGEDVNTLPQYFEGTIAWMDGLRLDICRPHKNQTCCYNGWLKKHNLMTAYVTSPDGFYLGRWDLHPGHLNDIAYQSYYHINQKLEDIGLKVGSDKGFFAQSFISPLPKENSLDPLLGENTQKYISIMRTAACEWPNGSLRADFPFLNCKDKHRIYQGIYNISEHLLY